MYIQIVGMGVNGKVLAGLLRKMGHEVIGYDAGHRDPDNIKVFDKPATGVDLTFICSPEKDITEVIGNLVANKVSGLYVIKSAVSPGTTQTAMLKYGVHICHNPEFLQEATSIEDALNQEFVIIGECCRDHGDSLEALYKPLGARIIRTRPGTSEMANIIRNNYLSLLIVFWNEIHNICASLNLDTREVVDLVRNDERVGSYGTASSGKPFNDKRLIDDLDKLLKYCYSRGMSPRLFETVKSINTELELLAHFR